MFKKLFVVTLLTVLTLSACGSKAPAETAAPAPTEAQPATTTEVPAEQIPVTGATEVLETPTETPEVTSTPSIPRPTNEPGCTNSAAFVSDVTIPDNTVIDAGDTFTKTWRISNTGTCVWAWDYTLTYYSENRMGAVDSVPLDITYPGETIDISVELIAPPSPGTYRGNFVIKNPEGLIMQVDNDSRLWLIIKVENTAPTPTTETTTNTSPTSTGSSISGSTGGANCSSATDVLKLTDVINAINAYRAQNGLPNYTVNTLLVRAAQRHANDIACNNLFVHTGSDGSTPESRVAATGYVATSVSENVYGSYPPLDGQGVVNWWSTDTTDPRHNRNLLSNTFTEIGVGYAFFNNYGYYVLVLAKP
jgi:uncharacterized protein YkwD/predicted small lipoprotein YifL